MAFISELRRRNRQHPAELASADDPDRGARRDDHSGASAMPSVCRCRH
jgi:hypothetical protein